MNFLRRTNSFLNQGFLESNCNNPQSLTQSQYNWQTVAPLDKATTRHKYPVVFSFSYASFAPAASIADTYLPRFTRWVTCPSSNHLLAHCKFHVTLIRLSKTIMLKFQFSFVSRNFGTCIALQQYGIKETAYARSLQCVVLTQYPKS